MRNLLIPFYVIGILLFCSFVYATHQEEPTWDSLTPKLQEESKVIEYILDEITEWIEKQEWVNYYPEVDGRRSEKIAKIIEKYEYPYDNYYVRVRSFNNALTGKTVYYEVGVTIRCKADIRYVTVRKWEIYLVEEKKKKKKGI